MKNLIKLGLIILTLTFITSCEKEPDTDIKMIENELKNLLVTTELQNVQLF